MKKLIASLLLVNCVYASAQKTDADYSPAQYKANTCHSSFIKVKLENGNVQQYLKQSITNLKDYRTGLKLNYVKESPGGFHYSFTQTFNGLAVYQSEIKVNLDRQNVIHSIFDNSENTSIWNLNTTTADASSLILVRNEIAVLCKREITDKGKEILTANGEIIFERDMNSYANQDSVVSGKVFLPDPLTSSQHAYGAPYFDNNDSTNASLDAELKPVNFTATYTGTNFILENSFVRVRDFDLPTVAPVTSSNGQFN
jgi:Zn-dependent metalloprotease